MKGWARRIFWNWTCSSTTSCSALRGYNVLVSSSMGMGWICCSLHFHGGDFNGREGWAGKLLQVCWKSSAKGWALSSFFRRNMFKHNLQQRSAWAWRFGFFIRGYGIDLFQPPCPWWRLWTGRLGGKLLHACWKSSAKGWADKISTFSTEHVYPQPTAALHGGSNHGWEGRVGKRTCWLVCWNFFRDSSFSSCLDGGIIGCIANGKSWKTVAQHVTLRGNLNPSLHPSSLYHMSILYIFKRHLPGFLFARKAKPRPTCHRRIHFRGSDLHAWRILVNV